MDGKIDEEALTDIGSFYRLYALKQMKTLELIHESIKDNGIEEYPTGVIQIGSSLRNSANHLKKILDENDSVTLLDIKWD